MSCPAARGQCRCDSPGRGESPSAVSRCPSPRLLLAPVWPRRGDSSFTTHGPQMPPLQMKTKITPLRMSRPLLRLWLPGQASGSRPQNAGSIAACMKPRTPQLPPCLRRRTLRGQRACCRPSHAGPDWASGKAQAPVGTGDTMTKIQRAKPQNPWAATTAVPGSTAVLCELDALREPGLASQGHAHLTGIWHPMGFWSLPAMVTHCSTHSLYPALTRVPRLSRIYHWENPRRPLPGKTGDSGISPTPTSRCDVLNSQKHLTKFLAPKPGTNPQKRLLSTQLLDPNASRTQLSFQKQAQKQLRSWKAGSGSPRTVPACRENEPHRRASPCAQTQRGAPRDHVGHPAPGIRSRSGKTPRYSADQTGELGAGRTPSPVGTHLGLKQGGEEGSSTRATCVASQQTRQSLVWVAAHSCSSRCLKNTRGINEAVGGPTRPRCRGIPGHLGGEGGGSNTVLVPRSANSGSRATSSHQLYLQIQSLISVPSTAAHQSPSRSRGSGKSRNMHSLALGRKSLSTPVPVPKSATGRENKTKQNKTRSPLWGLPGCHSSWVKGKTSSRRLTKYPSAPHGQPAGRAQQG